MPLSVRKDLAAKVSEVDVIREGNVIFWRTHQMGLNLSILDLKKLGKQIEDYEQNYLEDTLHYGNVISGWTSDSFRNAEDDKKTPKKMTDIPPGKFVFNRPWHNVLKSTKSSHARNRSNPTNCPTRRTSQRMARSKRSRMVNGRCVSVTNTSTTTRKNINPLTVTVSLTTIAQKQVKTLSHSHKWWFPIKHIIHTTF